MLPTGTEHSQLDDLSTVSGVGRDRFRTGSSFVIGNTYLNIIAQPADKQWSWWGRLILHVLDTDSLYERAIHAGLTPEAPPREAEWGERYFHLTDHDGHELSFATPLGP